MPLLLINILGCKTQPFPDLIPVSLFSQVQIVSTLLLVLFDHHPSVLSIYICCVIYRLYKNSYNIMLPNMFGTKTS